jgi:hypothetical protein
MEFEMTPDELLKFCTEQPQAADNLIAACSRSNDFQNGRGRLLAALLTIDQPKTAKKPKLFLIK